MAVSAATMAGEPKPWEINEKCVRCRCIAGSRICGGRVLHRGVRSWLSRSISSFVICYSKSSLVGTCSAKILSNPGSYAPVSYSLVTLCDDTNPVALSVGPSIDAVDTRPLVAMEIQFRICIQSHGPNVLLRLQHDGKWQFALAENREQLAKYEFYIRTYLQPTMSEAWRLLLCVDPPASSNQFFQVSRVIVVRRSCFLLCMDLITMISIWKWPILYARIRTRTLTVLRRHPATMRSDTRAVTNVAALRPPWLCTWTYWTTNLAVPGPSRKRRSANQCPARPDLCRFSWLQIGTYDGRRRHWNQRVVKWLCHICEFIICRNMRTVRHRLGPFSFSTPTIPRPLQPIKILGSTKRIAEFSIAMGTKTNTRVCAVRMLQCTCGGRQAVCIDEFRTPLFWFEAFAMNDSVSLWTVHKYMRCIIRLIYSVCILCPFTVS